MQLEFSQQTLEKSSNVKFNETLSSGSQVIPCGQTDGHDQDNCLKTPKVSGTLYKDLNVFHIAGTDICSITVHRTHAYASMATLSILHC